MILYEYPLQERIRTYLRLEHLFGRLGQLIVREDALDHHFALATLFEIMDVATRADLKSDLLKDLDRQKHALEVYRGNPAIAESALNQIVAEFDQCFNDLNNQPGKAGQALADNEWLMSIRSRIGIPGGTCEFDLPSYFAWQHKAASERKAELAVWADSLAPLAESVQLLLRLLRESGGAQKVMANAGQFQQTLPQGRTYLLLRVAIPAALQLIPEISGNRLMVSIRWMRMGDGQRPQAVSEDVDFELALCA